MSEKEVTGQQDQPSQEQTGSETKKRFSLEKLGKNLTETFETIKKDYPSAEVKKRVDQLTSQTEHYLDETGVTEKVSRAYGATQEHLDTVTGAKLLQLAEERMELQAKYNDILATKLAEALQRIEVLEKHVAGADPK